MYVKFKTLQFKNINSYGNKLTTFDFEHGLNLIAGANGKGKSTIIDALCYCLFGSPFRRIKIKELINRHNKKKLWTNVTFTIGKHDYQITRGLKPDKFSIMKNGDPLELLSSKKLIQTEIDKILGLDITLFRQVISLAINYSKPFLSLYSTEKRDIIETIFNVKVFGTMFKSLKVENSGIKSEYDINHKTISILESNLKAMAKQIEELEYTSSHFERDKEKEIKRITKNINQLDRKISMSTQKEINVATRTEKLENNLLNIDLARKEKLNQGIGKSDGIINHSKKDIKFFDTHDNCPVCDSDISGDNKHKHIEKLEKRLDYNVKQKEKQQKEKEKLTKQIESNQIKEEKINKNKAIIKSEQDKIKFYSQEKKKYEDTLNDVNKKVFNFDIESLKSDFKEKKKEYKETYNKLSTMRKEISINDIIFNILGDEGIKSHFFAKLIPILNKKVNEYLAKFDIPITLRFNEFMEETISTFGEFSGLNYHSFSEGEKKRIDIAILLSFIETTKIISNWSTNIIFFDELLDTSTDEDGMLKIMDSIKTLIIKDKHLCIYVMTHRQNDYYYDHIYNIVSSGNFSKIQGKTESEKTKHKVSDFHSS